MGSRCATPPPPPPAGRVSRHTPAGRRLMPRSWRTVYQCRPTGHQVGIHYSHSLNGVTLILEAIVHWWSTCVRLIVLVSMDYAGAFLLREPGVYAAWGSGATYPLAPKQTLFISIIAPLFRA